MTISSFDIKYNQTVTAISKHFNKPTATRQELLDYQQQSGVNIPVRFWSAARIGRGVFSLATADTQEVRHEPAKVFKLHNQHNSVKQHTVSKFDVDAMIPQQKHTFVEWGNFKTVESLIGCGEFFSLYISGDSGSGKNEMVDQACAKLKRPIVRVSITRETKEEHLIGSKTLVDGNIIYEDGPVKWAAENGAVLLLDEISTGDPNELMCLQAVLEGQQFFIKSANTLVTPAKGFCVIATDNTKGRGSDSGRYIGTNILNDAFLERFEMTMDQGYPTETIETKIIQKLMDSIELNDDEFLTRLMKWVHAIRKTYIDDGLEEHITTRRACHIVKTYKKLKKADTAIELCINRFDETTRMAMLSLWNKLGSDTNQEQSETF